MTSTSILWITAAIMAVGGTAILLAGKHRTPREGLNSALHGMVPLIAACAYVAMATGQGLVVLPTDAAVAAGTAGPTRIFYYARYLDWIVTTPLLLISLGLMSMRRGVLVSAPIVAAVIADVLMIVTAFAFSASEHDGPKWLWFAISCAAFLGVYYVIWVWQPKLAATQRADDQAAYRRYAAALSVIWFIYPLILAVSPDGLGTVGDTASVLVIAVLDTLAKVVYGWLSMRTDTVATDRDLAELGTTAGVRTVV